MGLRTHVGQLRALIEDVDPEIVRLVLESWLTPDELNRGLMTFEPTDLREAGFFDAIKRISNTHRKSRDTRACPKGQKMVFGTCREIGATGDTPPKDFFAAAQQIAAQGPDAFTRTLEPSKKAKRPRAPRKGEDDSHMPPAWHRKTAERFAQQADFHRGQAARQWAGDPRSAAHHVLRAIEYDVRRQHHDAAAGMSPQERQRAAQANTPPRPVG
jgi:hypothetical protein